MSGPVGSSTWFGEPGYNLNQSLRFNQPSDTTLSKTFASAGNRKTWTFSAWVKIGNPAAEGGNQLGIFGTYTGNNDTANIQFDGSGELHFEDYSGSYAGGLQVTEAKQRDTSSWYHIMVVYDTTQGTAANRIKLYVNSSLLTTKTGGAHTLPDQNHDGKFNNTAEHKIGMVNGTYCWDGYMAEVNFIDGTALGPESFGTTGVHGQWIPIEYTGAYGTNGFHLDFSGEGIMLATGGSIATDGDYKVHSFTSSGTFTPTIVPGTKAFVQYLVIAGGGGGGFDRAAGGGAGGYRTGFLEVAQGTGLTVTVGAGGAGAPGYAVGTSGSNSVFSTITSIGGGGAAKANANNNDVIGRAGGSGGGGSGQGTTTPGAGTSGQGNAGGAGQGGGTFASGGGGGAGAVGAAGVSGQAGAGGVGLASSITGSSVYRAGGGGGGKSDVSGGADSAAGGNGGGGAGGASDGADGVDGSANTGGGGGGGANNGAAAGGAGGSDIVIMRYKFQ